MDVQAKDLFAVAYLIFLEGVLSVDNALALAALVRGRLSNKADRQKALRYGILGAYAFRIAIIFAGVWLMQHAWVRWVAAIYLVYLGMSELFFKKHMDDGNTGGVRVSGLSPLWATVISVELMDIMFSVDSIAVALSVSPKKWVLITGAVLGILAMRFAAQAFIKLIERFPTLEKTAFVLVLMAGLKIVAELLGYEVPELMFMVVVGFVLAMSFVVDINSKKQRGFRQKV
jgi:YkoY family integral membrane protein